MGGGEETQICSGQEMRWRQFKNVQLEWKMCTYVWLCEHTEKNVWAIIPTYIQIAATATAETATSNICTVVTLAVGGEKTWQQQSECTWSPLTSPLINSKKENRLLSVNTSPYLIHMCGKLSAEIFAHTYFNIQSQETHKGNWGHIEDSYFIE